jgi:hypothetical protein
VDTPTEPPSDPDPEPHKDLTDDELAALLTQVQAERQRRAAPRRGWLPRPPQIETSADFIVVVFAVTVATILMLLAVGLVVAAFRGGDVKSYFAIMTSIVTSLISALVGYLAGRGQGKEPPAVV